MIFWGIKNFMLYQLPLITFGTPLVISECMHLLKFKKLLNKPSLDLNQSRRNLSRSQSRSLKNPNLSQKSHSLKRLKKKTLLMSQKHQKMKKVMIQVTIPPQMVPMMLLTMTLSKTKQKMRTLQLTENKKMRTLRLKTKKKRILQSLSPRIL